MAEMKQFGIDLELDDTVAQATIRIWRSYPTPPRNSLSILPRCFLACRKPVSRAALSSRPNTPNGCCVRCRRISCVMKAMWARSKYPLLRRFPKRVPRWVKLKIATARPFFGRAVFIRYLESSFSIAAAMRSSSSCAAPSDPRTMRPLRSITKERGTPCSA